MGLKASTTIDQLQSNHDSTDETRITEFKDRLPKIDNNLRGKGMKKEGILDSIKEQLFEVLGVQERPENVKRIGDLF